MAPFDEMGRGFMKWNRWSVSSRLEAERCAKQGDLLPVIFRCRSKHQCCSEPVRGPSDKERQNIPQVAHMAQSALLAGHFLLTPVSICFEPFQVEGAGRLAQREVSIWIKEWNLELANLFGVGVPPACQGEVGAVAEVAGRRIPFQNWCQPSIRRQGQLQPQVNRMPREGIHLFINIERCTILSKAVGHNQAGRLIPST